MTEQEAAERLCALLNEIEAAGHEVEIDETGSRLWIGDWAVKAPRFDDGVWETVEDPDDD